MRVLVIGSGLMGKGAAFDLSKNDSIDSIFVADIDKQRSKALAKELGPKVHGKVVDARNRKQVASAFSDVDAAISCISYNVNLLHTEIAIDTGIHFCDLGGNLHIVKKQLEMNDRAKDVGVTIIPDCGLAPGMTNVLAKAGIEKMSRVDSVKIRVGGLQQEPRPPLNYSLIFSVEGLINEYVEPCMVLREGKITFEDPLNDFEQIQFPGPFDHLEAFNTSGGTSTLPLTYEGMIQDLDYKTIRYPGHGRKMRCLLELGLMDSVEQDFNGIEIAPRVVLERLLDRNLPPSGKDVTLIRVSVKGWKGSESSTIEYEVIDYYDEKTSLTSMMRTTSFTASVALTMTLDGRISERGVLPPERSIPSQEFIKEIQARGIDIKERIY